MIQPLLPQTVAATTAVPPLTQCMTVQLTTTTMWKHMLAAPPPQPCQPIGLKI